eukprot:COSAG04_NODE_22314_length_357_cov_0.604651_1_plen_20_part_01
MYDDIRYDDIRPYTVIQGPL